MQNIWMTSVMRRADDAPWPRDAQPACAEAADPELWFPKSLEEFREATSVCAGCPMRLQCLDIAMIRKETGAWGGQLLERGKIVNPRAELKSIAVA